jgi:NAD(P)-dependent dehydrogenase (short-subunit alcohol dehydrogenase family)
LRTSSQSRTFGRIGRPDDVAEGIVAIMTTGWITGQAAIADGGIGLTTPRGAWRMEHVFGVTPAETP